MRKIERFLLIGVVVFLFAGCVGPKVKAPVAKDGGRFKVAVLYDRGIKADMTNPQIEQLNQLGEWAERDLLWMMKNAGYQARKIQEQAEFDPAPGEYLLSVQVVRYNPGSKAARIIIGLGAGSTSLDRSYELFGNASGPLLSKKQGIGSSIDWSKVVQKLNRDMIDDISRVLAAQ